MCDAASSTSSMMDEPEEFYLYDGSGTDDDALDEVDESKMQVAPVPVQHKPLRCTILSREAAFGAVEAASLELAQHVGCSQTSALQLLRQYSWSADLVWDRYFGAEGGEARPAMNGEDHVVAAAVLRCAVCRATGFGLALACKHACCVDCWRSHIDFQLNNVAAAVALRCPVQNCTQHFGVDAVDLICGPESNQSRRYVERVVDTFVASHPQYRACPSPRSCPHVIRLEGVISHRLPAPVDCACGHRFCFHCGLEDHRPATCDMLRQWEAELAAYGTRWGQAPKPRTLVASIPKHCPGPHCGIRVEKDGGCNHMTCTRCRWQWCWLCLQPWATHDRAQCFNRTDAPSENQSAELDWEMDPRTLHYGTNFVSHKRSRSEVATLIRSRATAWSCDQEHLMAAAEVLAQCHHVLLYSYVYVYHLPDTREKCLFEDLQLQLERLVTRLVAYCGTYGDTYPRSDVVRVTLAAKEALAKVQGGCAVGA